MGPSPSMAERTAQDEKGFLMSLRFTAHGGPFLLGAASLSIACSGQVDAPVAPTPAEPVSAPAAVPQSPAPAPRALPPPPPEAVDTPELLRAQVETVFARSCGECHGTDGIQAAGMNYIDNLDQLIANDKVVAGDAVNSPVIRRILDGSMPPKGSGALPPTGDEVLQISEFINGLVPTSPVAPEEPELSLIPCAAGLVTFDDVFSAIQSDLLSQDADDRRFIRYLSLSNRHNASACAEDLQPERWAMSKLVNSLSTQALIRQPVAIDEQQLIFRIDIRDYGWARNINGLGLNFNDGWEAIVSTSPYAVEFEGPEADFVVNETETEVPFLFSNALVAAASSGPVYYGLVDAGDSIDELFSNLRVDVQRDLDNERAIRAGTTRSAISRQNRVVQRHDLGFGGSLWQSFDFGSDDSDGDMFTDPLGFEPGETEVIFTLPNGLHGYASFDDNGQALEESSILFDTFLDDFSVRSAVSCMTCHSRGVLEVRDEVRPFVEANRFQFRADEFDAVENLYPTAEDLDFILNQDRSQYLNALAATEVPTNVPDPVSASFTRFSGDLDLNDVAGDLAITAQQLDDQLSRLDPSLSGLDDGLTVERASFDEVFLESLCVMQGFARNRPSDDLCFGFFQ